MKTKPLFTSALAILLVVGSGYVIAIPSMERDGLLDSLAGREFAVEAEVVFSADPAASGLAAGDTFHNCYIFEDDNVWIDPLFTAQGAPVVWIASEKPYFGQPGFELGEFESWPRHRSHDLVSVHCSLQQAVCNRYTFHERTVFVTRSCGIY